MTDVHWLQIGSQYFAGGEGTVGVFIESLRGLDELSDARASLDRIPYAHGSFEPTDVWRDSLAVTVSGTIHGEDRADAERLRDALKNDLAGMLDMRFSDTTGIWNMRVRVDNVRPADMGAWASMIPVTIDMIAPDPVRYSDVLPFGPVGLPVLEGGLFLPASLPWDLGVADLQVAEVVNAGSLPVCPVVTLQGSASSVVVHGGPRVLSFGAFAGTLVLDSLQRRAFLNGADVTRQLVQRGWFLIPPGESHGFSFEAVAPSPGLYMSGEYRIGVW